jgi:hypothetical protein
MKARVSPLWWPLLAISAINAAGAKRVLLSGHDTGDHALARMQGELDADTAVLKAGTAYHL